MTFLRALLIDGVIVALLGWPLWHIARQDGRPAAARNFAIGAALVVVATAMITAASERQVAECFAAGNPECIDGGAFGMRLVLIGGFAAVSWFTAFSIRRG